MSLLTALLIVLSMTPLGYLNIGPLAITLNVIPVAIAGIALGPTGGAILGAVFGVTSYLQAMGIGGASAMGLICFEISPFLTFVHRVLSRILAGYLTGWVFRLLSKRLHIAASSAITGFAAAFLNTVFSFSESVKEERDGMRYYIEIIDEAERFLVRLPLENPNKQ